MSSRSIALLLLLSGMGLACGDDEPVCSGSCPGGPTMHPQGTLVSLDQSRDLTIAGDTVEVRASDGAAVRYRFKETKVLAHQRGPQECGPRPAAFDKRSFEIASVAPMTVVLSVRARAGSRFLDHTEAIVRDGDQLIPSTTTRAIDGSLIEVTIELTTSVAVEIAWTLETSTGESIAEQVTIRVERRCTGSCLYAVGVLSGLECLAPL